ncbi:Phage integrase family protein [Faunimonas pinastri]|uniref:Phage integrase family protein n=1 Tax=Faunimonas pinastri TaxID=1855383 RepID=A0A1H9N6E2_9HYPH|nr:site-specific integrase [Faunimonas pinastri]SER31225.1 Phage integrase family protein [Faunimonas pinastri]
MAVEMESWEEMLAAAQLEDPEHPERVLNRKMRQTALEVIEQEREIADICVRTAELKGLIAHGRDVDAMGRLIREKLGPATAELSIVSSILQKLPEFLRQKEASAPDFPATLVELEQRLSVQIQNAHRTRWSGRLLSDAVNDFLEWKTADLGPGSKHATVYPTKLKLFYLTVGDKPLRDYSAGDVEGFRDLLDRTPAHALQKHGAMTDLKSAVAIADAENERRERKGAPAVNVIKPGTVDDAYLSPVKTMFEFFKNRGMIEINPARGIVSRRTREANRYERDDESRLPFNVEQINLIFQLFARFSPASEMYWLPVLALYTGARLNELCQLTAEHVRLHNQRFHLDLLTETESRLRPKRLKLKSAAARRLVPIHDELIRIGFLDFVELRRKGGGRLFQNLEADQWGYYSGAVGKRLNRGIHKLKIRGPDYTFYSFRHCFSAACTRAAVPDRTKDRLMGHKIQGAQGYYGSPKPEPEESAVIDHLSFPGVDLSPYLQDKPSKQKKARRSR